MRLGLRAILPPAAYPGVWFTPRFRWVRLTCSSAVESLEAEGKMPKAAFYAVAAGRTPGVYTTWDQTEKQVSGYAGARHKKFNNEKDAMAYIAEFGGPATQASLSKPTLKPTLSSVPPSKPRTTAPEIPASGVGGRARSPILHAEPDDLPPDLQKLANKGWTFSKKEPVSIVVYTDGSSIGNGKHGAKAGLGVWWGSRGEAAAANLSERVPGTLQTNNRGELLSVIRALETYPHDLPLEIRTDSQYTINCMSTWIHGWIKNNFKTSGNKYGKNGNKDNTFVPKGTEAHKPKEIKNVDMIKHLLVLLRRRPRVRFKYVPGHKGVEGNVAADLLARMGSAKPALPERTDWLKPEQDDRGGEDILSGVDFEIDADWLLTPEEIVELEKET